MRVALILNRRSGSVGDPSELVAAIRARVGEVTVHEPGQARAAVATTPERLIAAGGDGSLGDAFAAAAAAGVPLAVIAAGTANDFAHALHLPIERDAAVALATDPAARRQPTWGGTVAGRPFVNVASVGLAVDAAERADTLKSKLGPLAYAAGAVHAGIVGRSVDARLERGHEEVARGAVFQVLVGASGRFGGGSGLGQADPTDPQLVAAWVPAKSRLELPVRAVGLRNRTLEQQSGVEWWRAPTFAATAVVHGHPASWNVDGELWRPGSSVVHLRTLGPVDVIVPA
ncbi:MAG: diacylglycerol kinase family protein [Patulibacter minatonensis]